MIWDFEPNKHLVHVGRFILNPYSIFFIGSFFLGSLGLGFIFYREKKSVLHVPGYFLFSLIGAIVGARLFHCVFYYFDYYWDHPLEIFGVGGLASHGGLIGAVVTLSLYKLFCKDQSILWIADRTAIASAFIAGCIRLGNFTNSEILGKPTDLPWAITFAKIDNIPRHPAMLYESLFYFFMFFILLGLYFRAANLNMRGKLMGTMMVGIFGFRFFIEFLKEPQSATDGSIILNMGVGQHFFTDVGAIQFIKILGDES